MTGRWRQTTPDELATWLEPVPVPWAFAGGWALDLWAGHTSRTHSDIEITCLRGDLKALVDSLAGFEIVVARNKQLSPWRAGTMAEPPFSLWLRRHGELLWDFEIVSEAHADDAWHYRRDERISRPLDLSVPADPFGPDGHRARNPAALQSEGATRAGHCGPPPFLAAARPSGPPLADAGGRRGTSGSLADAGRA